MQATLPLTKELLMIGGGHAHALVLQMWGMKPLAGVRISVINPGPTAPYTGMLPGFVAGHYSRDELDIDLVRLTRFAGARLILDKACSIDPVARSVTLCGGRVLPYDIASLDIGITSDLPSLKGFAEFGIPAKPLGPYAARWSAYREFVGRENVRPKIVVVGGGVGGVELALAMHHALISDGATAMGITLIESDTLLKNMGIKARNSLISQLINAGISVLEQSVVANISARSVLLADGTEIPSQFTITTAGARPQDWLQGTGLHLTNGFVSVDENLRSVNVPEIFAVGDCAHMVVTPRPKAGVFAVRQAPVLRHNLCAVLSGSAMKKFHPQSDYLKLISLGEKLAVADKWGLRLRGRQLWRLKDQIDRKFMDQFQELKPMASPDLPKRHALGMAQALGDKPLCGGCGAKIGAQALSSVLAAIPSGNRKDILSGPGDDAATLAGPDGQMQVITTDHLRAFTNDPWLMSRITAIHALGDIWAMGARPQAALATVILPIMNAAMQTAWLTEIMNAAGEVFVSEGADIVGGHSSLGSELTIGFSVTGLCRDAPITLKGARPGDKLVLTKPIGTGTLLAGEMGLRARGGWVTGALRSMAQSQSDAAAVLSVAHAMTDVTGFGLAGHALELAKASGVGIELELNNIRYLPGAIELTQDGVRSSIYADNCALLPEIDPNGDPRAALLFDPQTAGGLLAAVPPEKTGKVMNKLRQLKYDATLIGHCTSATPSLTITS